MSLQGLLPADWQHLLQPSLQTESFQQLEHFLHQEWQQETVFPPKKHIFEAFHLTPYENLKVLILGQDPYHDNGQAHGLAFSVQPGVKLPPSLRNIFKERQSDLSLPPPAHGCLDHWSKQGILMLNAVLTVRAHQANSHKNRGWEAFTDDVIKAVNEKEKQVIFVLWGNYAKKKIPLIDENKHTILSSAHPSPLSARHGFFGSKPFSRINAILASNKQTGIDWSLPDSQPELALF